VQLDKGDIERSLKKKGFLTHDTHHKYLIYISADGSRTRVRTKLSHGALPKSISDELINTMAKQCRLTKNEFIDLVKCPLDQEKYEAILRDQNIL